MHHHAEPGPDKIPVRIDSSLEAIIPGFLANRQRDLTTIESRGGSGWLDSLGHS
jgi:aspartokinase